MKQDTCVFLMTKYPSPGKVKVRLSQHLSPQIAAALYDVFVQDILATLQDTRLPTVILYSPSQDQSRFRVWLGNSVEYIPQHGKDLGARLLHGFQDVFTRGYNKVMAVASDCPDLPKEILLKAADALTHNDVVIGPSPDGGYYLLGFQVDKMLPAVFHDIAWSTESVYCDTMKKIKEARLRYHVLPPWYDVDTIQDLHRLLETPPPHFVSPSHTMTYLRNHPTVLQNHKLG